MDIKIAQKLTENALAQKNTYPYSSIDLAIANAANDGRRYVLIDYRDDMKCDNWERLCEAAKHYRDLGFGIIKTKEKNQDPRNPAFALHAITGGILRIEW